MPTLNTENVEARISDDAFELLNCFYDGVDEVVRSIAEKIACTESAGQDVVTIEKSHVEKAGQAVLKALQEYLKEEGCDIDQDVMFKGLKECFNRMC